MGPVLRDESDSRRVWFVLSVDWSHLQNPVRFRDPSLPGFPPFSSVCRVSGRPSSVTGRQWDLGVETSPTQQVEGHVRTT